jgi:hypothetical protein
MSELHGIQCDVCGATGEGPYKGCVPTGWYTIYREDRGSIIPRTCGPFHFDKPECVAKWLEQPVNLPKTKRRWF